MDGIISHQTTRAALKDKILSGWTGKAYGCMMGEPVEYRAQGEIYEGSLEIHPKAPTTWLHNEDDLYVNMAFLKNIERVVLSVGVGEYRAKRRSG